MNDVVGVEVTSIPSANGKLPGVYLTSLDTVPLTRMGAGVANAVTILACLAEAENKVLLIEEPENDLHPAALKKLLAHIAHAASKNQIVVTTHSNIVLKTLGAAPGANIYRVEKHGLNEESNSTVTLVPENVESRREILEDLGYEFSDFDLADGWLFLEESSAQRILQEFLIPWFTPGLIGRVRTVAANGISDVEPKFEDFRNLFLYSHLESIYRKRTWVIVDGDSIGLETVRRLRETFKDYPEDTFRTFSEGAFEHYYPARFRSEVDEVLAIVDKKSKRENKRALLLKVVEWAQNNRDEARSALQLSAAPAIELLKTIEQKLNC
jgi:predicted ATP-dependent endonuclease of OLD family